MAFDVQCTDEGILLGTIAGEAYKAGVSAARCYYELHNGIPTDQGIRGLKLRIGTGGTEAESDTTYWRYSIYGRAGLYGKNLTILRRAYIRRTGSAVYDWRSVYISIPESPLIRCIVVKLECMAGGPAQTAAPLGWDDDAELGTWCPYGVRIKSATVYGSPLGRDVTAPRILKHIAEPYYPTASAPSDSRQYDQVCFRTLPYDRWEAIDAVCEMTGWDYQVWDDDLSFVDPDTLGQVSIPKSHAGVAWNMGPDESEAYNAVRVGYTNSRGRPREVIEHAALDLGDVVADYITAPETVRSRTGAQRTAKRWLKAHGRVPETGDVTVTGQGPWGDALHLRPNKKIGDEKVQHVRLDPLSWSASLSFGVNVDDYGAWLARLAAGVKSKKR